MSKKIKSFEVSDAFLNSLMPMTGLMNGKIDDLKDLELSLENIEEYGPAGVGKEVVVLEPNVPYKAIYADKKGMLHQLSLGALFYAAGDMLTNIASNSAFDALYPIKDIAEGTKRGPQDNILTIFGEMTVKQGEKKTVPKNIKIVHAEESINAEGKTVYPKYTSNQFVAKVDELMTSQTLEDGSILPGIDRNAAFGKALADRELNGLATSENLHVSYSKIEPTKRLVLAIS